jgi:acyl-coenzyme A synthetase/AMP-(fatty) acid ligase
MSTRQSVAAVLAMMAVSAVGLISLSAFTQMQPGDAAQRVSIAALLNLDATRAAQVEAILQASHEKRRVLMETLRAQTDAQLATVLTAEELSKLKDAMPSPHGPGDGARNHGTPM